MPPFAQACVVCGEISSLFRYTSREIQTLSQTPRICMGCCFLLQGIFPTQGSNPRFSHLLHRQADSLRRCHLGSPGWVYQSRTFDLELNQESDTQCGPPFLNEASGHRVIHFCLDTLLLKTSQLLIMLNQPPRMEHLTALGTRLQNPTQLDKGPPVQWSRE